MNDLPRALELLERIFSVRQGGRVPATMAREDVEWLVAEGLDPEVSVEISHDAAVAAVREAGVSVRDGALAFAASLDGALPRGCFLELGLLASGLPAHEGGNTWCRVCGLEPVVRVRPAERFLRWHTWGTGLPGDMTWMLTAREHSADAPRAVSSRLGHILHALDALPAKAVAGAAFDAVHALGIDKSAARSIVATLAFAGVLEAPPHVGLATRFVSFAERDERPSVRNENDAPLGFWKGENGVNWRNVEKLFGITKDTPLEAVTATADGGVSKPRKTKARAAKPKQSSASVGDAKPLKRRPPEPGDIWTFAITEDAWALVYVWKVETRQARLYALTEVIGNRSITKPDPPSGPLSTRPRYDGRWQYWTHSLDKTTSTALLATNAAPPTSTEPLPERPVFGSGKDLVRLARHCFVSELGY